MSGYDGIYAAILRRDTLFIEYDGRARRLACYGWLPPLLVTSLLRSAPPYVTQCLLSNVNNVINVNTTGTAHIGRQQLNAHATATATSMEGPGVR